MIFEGVYHFMWQDIPVAEVEFKNNYFYQIRELYNADRLPYFLEEQVDNNYLLSLFFSERMMHVRNPYYKMLFRLEWYRFISLFDDYWLKTDHLEYKDIREYELSKDSVFRMMTSGIVDKYLTKKYSPNLSLYATDMRYFLQEKNQLFLLMPYNAENAMKYKKNQVGYETIIYNQIPFLKVNTTKTEDTELYRFTTCIHQNKTEEMKREILKAITSKFTEHVCLDDIYIKVKNQKVEDVLLF